MLYCVERQAGGVSDSVLHDCMLCVIVCVVLCVTLCVVNCVTLCVVSCG